VDLEKTVAHEQRAHDAGLEGFLVLPADDETVDDRVHVLDRVVIDLHVVREVHRFAVHDETPAAFLPNLREDDVELFSVDLEDGRTELDFRALRQRENRVEDLAGRAAGCRLLRPRAMRFGDRRKQQIQIARDVGHGANGRPRVARERLLLDGDDRRQPEHEVHVRLRDLRDEPLRVARQRFHIPPLPFRVDRVEGQARLA
jgi:hypothetical protein